MFIYCSQPRAQSIIWCICYLRPQTFLAQAAVERLDVGIVRWFYGPGEVQLYLVQVRPLVETSSGKLGPVARREQALFLGYGHARSPQIAQRVGITESQVSTVVLHEPH